MSSHQRRRSLAGISEASFLLIWRRVLVATISRSNEFNKIAVQSMCTSSPRFQFNICPNIFNRVCIGRLLRPIQCNHSCAQAHRFFTIFLVNRGFYIERSQLRYFRSWVRKWFLLVSEDLSKHFVINFAYPCRSVTAVFRINRFTMRFSCFLSTPPIEPRSGKSSTF